MKKISGQPNVKVSFDKKIIEISIIIISNETEQKFFNEVFNRYFNIDVFLLHRTLLITEPYSGQDEFGQKIYADKFKKS
jgi:hypothetical protein